MDIYEIRQAVLRSLIGENSLKDFASAFDSVDASYLSQILNGHRRLGEKAALTLACRLGVAPKVLIAGHHSVEDLQLIGRTWAAKGLKPPAISELYSQPQTVAEPTAVHSIQPPKKLGLVPVVARAKPNQEGVFDLGMGQGGYLDIPSNDKDAYALEVLGNGLHPRIKNGEYVVVEPNHRYLPGDEVLVLTQDGRGMVKEFIYHRDGQYRFDSVRDGYPPIFLGVDDVRSIGYILGILKDSRYTEE